MSQGRLFQLPCLQVLLVAFAIQGITPDAQDLASVSALRIVCPILTEFDTTADHDEWPDDVCEPIQSGARLFLPRPGDRNGLLTFETAMANGRFRPIEPASLRFAARHADLASITDLTCTRCRLIC